MNFVDRIELARKEVSEDELDHRLQAYYRAFHLARNISAQLANLYISTPTAILNVDKMNEKQKESKAVSTQVQGVSEISETPSPTYPYLYLIGLGTAIGEGVSLDFVIASHTVY